MEVLLCGTDAGVYALDVQSGAQVQHFKDSCTCARAFGPVGNDTVYIAAAQTHKPLLFVWHWGKEQPCYRAALPERLTASAWSSDGSMLFAGGTSGKVYVWHVCSGHLLRCWDCHFKAVTAIHVSEDDSLLITASEDTFIHVFAIPTVLEEHAPQSLRSWSGHSLPVSGVAVVGGLDGRVASVGMDRCLKIWEVNSGVCKSVVLPAFANQVIFSPHGRSVFAACNDAAIRRVQVETECAEVFLGHVGPVRMVSLTMDGQTLASCATDGVRLWDVKTRQTIRHLVTQFRGASVRAVRVVQRLATQRGVAPFKALQRAISPLDTITHIPVFSARSIADVPQAAKSVDEWFEHLQMSAGSIIASAKLKEHEQTAKEAVDEQQAWADAAIELFEAVMAKNDSSEARPRQVGITEKVQEDVLEPTRKKKKSAKSS